MALATVFGEADVDPGTPYVFDQDKDTGKDAVAFVAQQTPEFTKQMLRKYGRRSIPVKGRTGDHELLVDVERQHAEHIERAIHVLRNTENFALKVGGPAMAEKLNELLPRQLAAGSGGIYEEQPAAPIKPGQDVCFDGKWTEPVKVYLLNLPVLYGFAEFVSGKALQMVKQAKEDEQGKD